MDIDPDKLTADLDRYRKLLARSIDPETTRALHDLIRECEGQLSALRRNRGLEPY